MRKTCLSAALVSLLVVAIAAPAAAGGHGQAGDVVIRDVVNNSTLDGNFTARGPAVRDGLVCRTGTSVSSIVGFTAGGYQMEKVLSCKNGGTYTVDMTVTFTSDPNVADMEWTLLSGDGSVMGEGDGTVTSRNTNGVHIDVHLGELHLTP